MTEMSRTHSYRTVVTWTGNQGTGTSGYHDYERAHEVSAQTASTPPPATPTAEAGGPGAGRSDTPGPATIAGSSDPAFRGDPARWNPEQLLVASLAQCHLLWYLHLCAVAGVVVTGYVDRAEGTMVEDGHTGRFTEVVLRPEVTVTDPAMVDQALALHDAAHRACYIANSVRFPVRHEPTILVHDRGM